MSVAKFTRKSGSGKNLEALKEKYDDFLLTSVFEVLKLDLDFEEKVDLIKDDYKLIADPNIERNELFLKTLTGLKQEILTKSNPNVIQSFVEVLMLLCQADVINHMDYISLINFKEGPEPQEEAKVEPKQEEEIILRPLSLPKIITNPINPIIEPPRPPQGFRGSEDEVELDIVLESYIEAKLETRESKKKKDELILSIDKIFSKVDWNNFKIDCHVTYMIYGSHVNEISLPSSDIDISLNTNCECDPRDLLRFFKREIRKELSRFNYEMKELLSVSVSVPLIDIIFQDYDITVSFSVNNTLGEVNSQLLRLYSQLDPRCKILCFAVKLWAQAQGIVSTKDRYLSSYAYNLMVINLLQCQDPPILPSLQALRYAEPNVDPDELRVKRMSRNGMWETFTTRLDYEDDGEKLKQIMKDKYSGNAATTVELLSEFFRFYGQRANIDKFTMSVKEGKRILKRPGKKEFFFMYSIEDPFDELRNAGRHVQNMSEDGENGNKILKAMQKSRELLEQDRVLDIFNPNLR